MSESYDDDFDWGDDPFEGDLDFDTDFDGSSKQGFLRSVVTGFLEGIVEKTVGDTDARVDTLKMVLPKTWTSAFSTLSDLNRRRRALVEEMKGEAHSSIGDLQYIAKRAGERLQKIAPNKIGESLVTFSQNDFSSWEKRDHAAGDDTPKMEGLDEGEVNDLLANETLTSYAERDTAIEVGNSITNMMTEVGGRTIGGLNVLNMSVGRSNQLLENIVEYQRKVQLRNDAMKINLLTRTYLTNAKFYKFVEASNHRMIKELKIISLNSGKSDFEKTSTSQAAIKSMRESMFNTVKSSFGGVRDFFIDKFGKQSREGAFSDIGEIAGGLRMALEMTDGMNINVGSMLGNAAAGMFINRLPQMIKSKRGRAFTEKFKKNFPELAEYAETAYKKFEDLGNVASYNLANMEGMANGLAEYYQQGFSFDDEEEYDDYLNTVPDGQKPLGKIEWNLRKAARSAVNKGAGFILEDMYQGSGTYYNMQRRTLTDGFMQEAWNKQSSRTLNEIIPEWLAQIHLSLEKLRTGDDTMKAMSYDYVKGSFIGHQEKLSDTLNTVYNKQEFRSQADSALRVADMLGANEDLTPESRNALAMQMVRHADKQKGFNPYIYMNLDKKGVDEKTAGEIKAFMQRKFGITDEIYEEFKEGDEAQRIAKYGYLPTEQGRELAAKVLQDSINLGKFTPDIKEKLDVLRATGRYDALKELGVIASKDGNEQVDMEKFWSMLNDFIQDPNKKQARGKALPEPQRRTRPFANGQPVPQEEFLPPYAPGLVGAMSMGNFANLYPAAGEGFQASEKGEYKETLEASQKLLSEIKSSIDAINERVANMNLGGSSDYSTLVDKLVAQGDKTHSYLDNLVQLATARNDTLVKLLEKAPGSGKDGPKTSEEREVEEGKRSLLDRLRNTSFRDIFNKGVDKVLDHEPLVLGGLLGGIAGMAIYNPKAAALVAGGFAAASVYGKIRTMMLARQAANDEDLYEEGSDTPILEAWKLRRGDYYDMMTNRVIDAWEGITGSLKDLSNNTVIGAKRLAAKLFTEDNKEVFLKGLSKVREWAIKAFKWFDPVGRAKKLWDKAADRFHQMDVYVEGEDTPALYGSRFAKGHYYVKDNDGRLVEIKGWNEITGAVFDKSGNVLITEEEYDRGLKTSMGMSVNKLGAASRKVKNFLGDVWNKVKEHAVPTAKKVIDTTKKTFKADYSPIVNSVDRIYNLLLQHWGYQPDHQPPGPAPFEPPESDITEPLPPEKEKKSEKAAKPEEEKEEVTEEELIERRRRNKLRRSTSGRDKEVKEMVDKIDPPQETPFKAPTIDEKEMQDRVAEVGKHAEEVLAEKPAPVPNVEQRSASMANRHPMFGFIAKKRQEILDAQAAKEEAELKAKPKSKAEADDETRANSVADRKRQADEKRKENMEEAIITIAEQFGYGKKKPEDPEKGGGGMFGFLAGALWKVGKFFTSKFLLSGFTNLFKMSTIAARALPAIVSGIGGIGSAIATLIQTRSLGAAAGDLIDSIRGGDPEERGERRKKRRKKQSTGRKFAGGAGKVGAGMAIAAGAGMLENMGVIDPDSGMGTALDMAGTAVSIYGGLQMAGSAATALGMGGAVSAVTGAATTVVGAGVAALAPLLFNPFTLGALAIGAVGYGVYKLITHGKDKQQELRLTQYGLSDTSGTLAEKCLKAEGMLQEYVVIGNGRASLNKSAPIEQVIQLFMSSPDDRKQFSEVFSWFNGRFKPVFLTYMACLDVVKIKTLKDYDETTSQDVYKVAKQSHEGLSGTIPYPYEITAKFDPDTPILNKKMTLIRVNNLLAELKSYVDRKTPPQEYAAVTTTKGQSKEGLEREKQTLEAKLNDPNSKMNGVQKHIAQERLKEVNSEVARLNATYKAGTVVGDVYITDLMPDGKALDMLTAIRVAAYGNDEDIPWRVEAVLKLERHCETFFKVEGDKVEFTGQAGEMFNLFKEAFRISERDADDWCLWFRDRFLPVLTNYMKVMGRYRKGRPGIVWKTLSVTARYEIAKALVETQVSITSALIVPVWNVKVSPFGSGRSTPKTEKVDRMLGILSEASVTAKLKDPELEAGRTNSKSWAETISPHKTGGGFTDKYANVQTADQYKNRRDTALGGQYGTTGGGTGNTNSATGAFKTPETQFGYKPITGDSDTEHLDMTGVTANEGTDKGVSVPRKLAEQLIIREMMKQGFTDPREIAEMLALTNYETGGYKRTTENMKYTSPGNLMKTFKEVTSLEQARQLIAAGEVAIANTVYGGGKGQSIGNTQPGDGYKYRGRGLVQLTGRANYRKTGAELGIDLEKNPELASNDPNVMAAIAVNFFKNNKLLRSISQTGDFGKAATGLNGGNALPGMNDRYALYLDYLKKLQEGNLTASDSELTKDTGEQTASSMYGGGGGGSSAPASAPASGGSSSGGGGMIGTPSMPSMGGSGSGGSAGQYMTPSSPSGGYSGVGGGGGDTGGSLVNSNTASGSGLRLKSEEAIGGGKHHPGLEALCNIIQSRVPNFRYWSALNDAYHVRKGSKGGHPKGLAADFTLTTGIQGSDQAASMCTEILRQAGLTPAEFLVINEYRRKTAIGTGGHVHVGFKSPAAADKFLQATKGTTGSAGQDTTGTAGGPVAPEAPTPTPPAPGAPTEMPLGGTEQPAAPAPLMQNPIMARRPPVMSNPAYDKDNLNTEKGDPEDGFAVPYEPKAPPRRTELPLPSTPPEQHPMPEGYGKNQERYAGSDPNAIERALNSLKGLVDGMGSKGDDQTQVLLAIHKELTKLNEKAPEGQNNTVQLN